jgi:TRAP-type C4-dicarboxylate transport system permease small subunit
VKNGSPPCLQIIKKFCKAEEILVSAFVAIITFLVFLSAVARGIRHPLNWAQDVSLLLFAWVVFLGADLALRKADFVRVDMFIIRFPHKVQKFLYYFFYAIVIAFLGILIIYGIPLCIDNSKRLFQTLGISYSWATISVPVGSMFFVVTPGIPFPIIVQKVVSSSQSFTLLAIPLFIFAGNLMNNTGITSRLVKLSNVLTGHMYGNLGQVSCVLSTLMGGVSGSANADAAMECRVLGPEMTKRGYAKGYSAAVNGVTSLITATIPPSMGLIIYGSVGEVSIGRLFAGALSRVS